MKTTKLLICMSILSGAFLVASCGNETTEKKGKEKLDIEKEVKTPTKPSKEFKIAYIDMDSVSSNYQFNKDVEELLKSKENSAQASLKAKEQKAQASLKAKYQALETRAAKFQKDLQNNKISSQEQYEKEQQAIAKLQQSYQAEEEKLNKDYQDAAAKLSNDYQDLVMEKSQAINDTIENFLELYGEEKGYDFILGKSKAAGSVLYSKESYDVTDEVIKALNKRYEQYKK